MGDASIAHAEASAQYALYNMILYAQARGLGSAISGGARLLLNPQKAARRRLGLGGLRLEINSLGSREIQSRYRDQLVEIDATVMRRQT